MSIGVVRTLTNRDPRAALAERGRILGGKYSEYERMCLKAAVDALHGECIAEAQALGAAIRQRLAQQRAARSAPPA